MSGCEGGGWGGGETFPDDIVACASRIAGVLLVLNLVVAHKVARVLDGTRGDTRRVHALERV